MRRGVTGAAVLMVVGCAWGAAAQASGPNQLTEAERKAGWRLLFDGASTKGWRGFKKPEVAAERWQVKDGVLETKPTSGESHGGADIITTDSFSDFDLRWEWRIAPAGNSGVKYFVTEERDGPIAHEYQLLDDDKHPDGKVGPHRQTGGFYDVLPPAKDKLLRPVGEWNESRVVVKGTHVEHWLNGKQVLGYELGSPELQAAIAKSKFKSVAGFGTKIAGHILLQDHGDQVSFRNVKILSTAK
jgi:hypothetical protein